MKNTLTLRDKLSRNEKKMFTDLGWVYIDNFKPNEVFRLYRIAVEKVFASLIVDNTCIDYPGNPNAIRALQKAIIHFREGKYRCNKEFEELIAY